MEENNENEFIDIIMSDIKSFKISDVIISLQTINNDLLETVSKVKFKNTNKPAIQFFKDIIFDGMDDNDRMFCNFDYINNDNDTIRSVRYNINRSTFNELKTIIKASNNGTKKTA